MKVADKTLIDSVLSVFRFSDSNKTAPKPMKNAPIFGRGKVKINYLILAVAATGCKGR